METLMACQEGTPSGLRDEGGYTPHALHWHARTAPITLGTTSTLLQPTRCDPRQEGHALLLHTHLEHTSPPHTDFQNK